MTRRLLAEDLSTVVTGTAAGTVAAGDDSRFNGIGTGGGTITGAATFTSGVVVSGGGETVTGGATIDNVTISGAATVSGAANIAGASSKLGFFANAGAIKQTVTGSKGSNAALTSLIAALVAHNLIADTTT